MSRKKISTTIYVTPEQSERLRLLHERTKVPVAVYIREGIDLVLRQYGHLLPGQLTLAPDAASVPPAIAPALFPPSSDAKAPSSGGGRSERAATNDAGRAEGTETERPRHVAERTASSAGGKG